jgi:hypothetical protein
MSERVAGDALMGKSPMTLTSEGRREVAIS